MTEESKEQTAETKPVTGEDQRLMVRVKSGDADAWNELVEKHYRKIYWTLFNLIKNSSWRAKADEAEDLCQETWSKVLRRSETYDPEKPLLPWLRAIALNSFYDWVEKQNRGPSSFTSLSSNDSDTMLDFADDERGFEDISREKEAAQHLLARVLRHLERKKPKVVVLFQLTRFLQLSPKDACEAIRLSSSLSASDIARSFARAKNEFRFDIARIVREYFSGELTHEEACRLLIVGGSRANAEFDSAVLSEIALVDNKDISDAVRKVNEELVGLFQQTQHEKEAE